MDRSLSAFRVCKGGGDPLSWLADRKKQEEHRKYFVYVQDNGNASTYCGACGKQQFKYGSDHSGDWCSADFCIESQIPSFCRNWCGRVWVCSSISCSGKLPSGAPCYLEKSEKYEKGFQTIQGLYAIGSGGLFGRGLGSSIQKLGFVPEAQNDMIFSVICEELGLFGASLLILVFMLLLWRLCVISTHSRDLLGALLTAGIMAHMAVQVILNIAVVTNTIPNTGITLPFVSYGGTSVVFLLGEMGLALSVSSHKRDSSAYNKK